MGVELRSALMRAGKLSTKHAALLNMLFGSICFQFLRAYRVQSTQSIEDEPEAVFAQKSAMHSEFNVPLVLSTYGYLWFIFIGF